jgi:hypothetical protein
MILHNIKQGWPQRALRCGSCMSLVQLEQDTFNNVLSTNLNTLIFMSSVSHAGDVCEVRCVHQDI